MKSRNSLVPTGEFLPSRRQFLQLGNMAILASLIGGVATGEAMKLREAKDAVDHLVLGVNDLQKGIEWFEKTTGVRPMVGGRHPNRGTQNALVSFGGRQYLELLAPDPQQAGHERAADLLKLTAPRLVLWASATNEIDVLAQNAKTAKLAVAGPLDGSRMRPDGKLLKWRSFSVAREADKEIVYFNVVPFFIQWDKDSLHPSQDSPTGCQLLSLEFAHPEAESVSAVMKTLGISANVAKASSPSIKATLKTPKGKVQLI
ncbi:MAG: VOC family protein [Acidobacteria bacterium]|nr:VOC family protein [Acidobacteriota bacterium]